jgi:hypothetical protein
MDTNAMNTATAPSPVTPFGISRMVVAMPPVEFNPNTGVTNQNGVLCDGG